MASTEQQSARPRRALLATAVWAAPSLVIATATPVLVASPPGCDPSDDGLQLTPTGHDWSMVAGELKTDENETGWMDADKFRSWDNNAWTTEAAEFDAVSVFAAAGGAIYESAFEVTVGAGTSSIGRDTQQVQIDVLSGAKQTQKIVWINVTQTWEEDLDGFINQYTWNTAPVPYSGTFTAAETSQATDGYRFTLPATPDVNDDIWVRCLTITQKSCSP